MRELRGRDRQQRRREVAGVRVVRIVHVHRRAAVAYEHEPELDPFLRLGDRGEVVHLIRVRIRTIVGAASCVCVTGASCVFRVCLGVLNRLAL